MIFNIYDTLLVILTFASLRIARDPGGSGSTPPPPSAPQPTDHEPVHKAPQSSHSTVSNQLSTVAPAQFNLAAPGHRNHPSSSSVLHSNSTTDRRTAAGNINPDHIAHRMASIPSTGDARDATTVHRGPAACALSVAITRH